MPADVEPLPDWLHLIDPERMRGLEIGALHKPRFDRTRTEVSYVDHAPTDELRHKYATDAAMADHLDEIVDVDFVWAGDRRLADAVGDRGPFDFVYASHVAEHAPDLIGWLDQLAEVLVDGGIVALALPDKRLCFDVNRALTEIADLVDAHLQGLTAPGYRQIYDFHSKMVAVDPALMWAGLADYRGVWRTDLDPDHVGLRAVPEAPADPRVRRRPLLGVHPGVVPRALRQAGAPRPDRVRDRLVPPDPAQHHRVPGLPAQAGHRPRRRGPPGPPAGVDPHHRRHRPGRTARTRRRPKPTPIGWSWWSAPASRPGSRPSAGPPPPPASTAAGAKARARQIGGSSSAPG